MKSSASNKSFKGAVVFMLAGGTFAASTASANLQTWVNAPGTNATDMQKSLGAAVQRTCAYLAQQTRTANTPTQDLFLRCNEMVQTANALEGSGATARSLGYTQSAQLLATLQQVSGEELATQGSLSTRVPSGQFANISGRLNALRLGGASVSARSRVAAAGNRGSAESSGLSAAILRDGDQVLPLRGAPSFYDSYTNALANSANEPYAFRRVRLELQDKTYSNLTAAASTTSAGGAAAMTSPWGWFTEGSYAMGDHDQTLGEDAFDFDSFSVTVGSDYNFGSAVAGASLGYDHYKADFETAQFVSGGDVTVKGISGSIFGAWFPGDWGLNGIASFGALRSDLSRRVSYNQTTNSVCTNCGADRTLSGSPDGNYFAVGAGVNRDFTAGAWQFSPSVSASYRKVDIDGYDETDHSASGGLALRYDEQEIESLRSIVGLQIAVPLSRNFGVLTPSLKAEWHHEFEDDPRTLRAKYLLEDTLQTSAPQDFGCAISCFSFSTDRADADFGVVGVGVSALFAQRLQSYVYYETLVGASSLTSHSIAIGLRGQF